MPGASEIKVRLEAEGLVGTDAQGKDMPIGILRDGKPVLCVRMYEYERENCEYCGGLMVIDTSTDDDDRCGRCQKSHRECYGCDASGAEVCIECEESWCSECWTSAGHVEICTRAAGGAPQEGKASEP